MDFKSVLCVLQSSVRISALVWFRGQVLSFIAFSGLTIPKMWDLLGILGFERDILLVKVRRL